MAEVNLGVGSGVGAEGEHHLHGPDSGLDLLLTRVVWAEAMSGKARQARDELELQFMGVRRSLQHVCETVPPVKRAVTRKVAEMEAVWGKLVRSHSLYCKAAGVGISSTESSEFMEQKALLKEEVLQTAETILGENAEEESSAVGKRLKRSVELLIAEVEFALPTLTGFTTDQLSPDAHQEALRMVQETLDKIARYMELCSKAEQLLEDTVAETLRESTSEKYKSHGAKLFDIRRQILKNTPFKPRAAEPKVRVSQSDGQEGQDGAWGAIRKQPMKIKPLDCPTWDGRFRTFARFKLLWEENINPRHEDSALHMMLCQALPKHILENISTLTNSASEIWAHLEEKYGKPEVVAKEVMGELMGLDSKKHGNRFIGKFSTTLQDTHTLLVSLGEEDWLTSNRTVSELKHKLPREEKFKWAELCGQGSLVGDTRFERFQSFLLGRKRVMEVIESMGAVGVTSTTKCDYCQKSGHTEETCFAKQRAQGTGGWQFRRNDGCAICGSLDHWKNECPDLGTDKDKKKRGRANTTRGGRGVKGGGQQGGVGGNMGVKEMGMLMEMLPAIP